jgi:hypothetical protein
VPRQRSGPPSGPVPAVPRQRSGPPSGPVPAVRPKADREPAQRQVRRVRRGPRLLAVLASLLLAGAGAGAGVWWFVLRPTTVQPAVYARSVCVSVRDWQQEIDGRTGALTKSIAQQVDPTAIRNSVADYYTRLATRTDALRTALVGAGIPDLPGGQDYADALVRTAASQAAALRDSATRAGRLDISNRTLFQISVQSLLTNESTSVTAVITALAHPRAGTSAELRTALADEPACAPYTG